MKILISALLMMGSAVFACEGFSKQDLEELNFSGKYQCTRNDQVVLGFQAGVSESGYVFLETDEYVEFDNSTGEDEMEFRELKVPVTYSAQCGSGDRDDEIFRAQLKGLLHLDPENPEHVEVAGPGMFEGKLENVLFVAPLKTGEVRFGMYFFFDEVPASGGEFNCEKISP